MLTIPIQISKCLPLCVLLNIADYIGFGIESKYKASADGRFLSIFFFSCVVQCSFRYLYERLKCTSIQKVITFVQYKTLGLDEKEDLGHMILGIKNILTFRIKYEGSLCAKGFSKVSECLKRHLQCIYMHISRRCKFSIEKFILSIMETCRQLIMLPFWACLKQNPQL